jgi:23S rRNA (uracil1939-C5)-methyltransferase
VQIEIESLAYGGAGVGRLQGEVFFVPETAPGELVEVEATRKHRRHRDARLLRILRPSPERVAPPCPHFGTCGGCQWQHLSAAAQLEAKRGALTEALVRLGKIPREQLAGRVTALAAPAQYAYRRRCRFMVDARGRLCFHERGDAGLVAIESCDLLSPLLQQLSRALSIALAGQPISGLTHLELCEASGRTAAEAVLEPGALTPTVRARLTSWLSPPVALAGVVVREVDRVVAELGTAQLEEPPLLLRPDVFSQPSRAGGELLRAQLIAAAEVQRGDRVLELYCGSGNFTFALAELGREVCAIEQDGHALRLARRALPAALASKVTFLEGDAAALSAGWSQQPGFDVAVLDPPRAGARPLLEALARSVRRRIVYVSCDPATFARDVAVLAPLGFELRSAVVLDLFPQTYHLETVATLDRASPP